MLFCSSRLQSVTPQLHTLTSISLSDACTLAHTFSVTHTSAVLNSRFGVFPQCTEQALTSTVREAVQDVALVAQALKAAGVVDAGVVAGPLEGALVNV